MSIKESALLDVGYPVYGAKFLDNKTLVVAGGGGEGNNGIPNKITVIKCSFKIKDKNRKLQRFREVTLPSNEDSPTCVEISKVEDNINFDRSKFNVFVGCNQSTEIIKKMNVNNHLRKYHFNDNEHLEFVDAAQLDLEVSSDSIGEYPKVINLAKDNSLGSFMTSKEPSTIYIFDPESLEVTNLILVSSSIKDFVLNPFDNGKSLCYVTSTSIEVISTSSSETVIHSTSNPIFKLDAVAKILSKYIITKVRYINEDEIILTANVRKGGVSVLKYSFKSKTITKINDFSRALKGLVALDVSVDQNLVAVAGNDFSLTLLRLSDFKVLKTFKKLHPFAITSVAFSPNGSKLATASASNAVNVFKIPKNYSKGTSKVGTLINYIFYTMIITILAIVLQASIENGQFDKYLALTKIYGGQVFEFVSEFSLHSLEYIKDKINHEKLDGDENTKKYFTIDEWSPSITSEESYTNTPLGEPVSTANEFSEVSISEDYSSIVETDTVTETTAIISDDFAYDGDVEDLAEETVDVESEDEESVDASSEYETESSFEEAVETESEELEARDFIEEDLEGETAEEYVSNATHSSDVSGETASIDSAVDGIEISAEAPVPAESEYTILEEPEDGSSTDIEIVSESEESEDSVVSELEDASEVEGASEEVLPSEASEEVETAAPEETAEDTPVEETEEPEIKTDEETSETDIEVETVETEEADSETEAVETSEEEVLETEADTSEAESETEAAETEGESETETVETSEGESETEAVETSEDEASETEAVETSEGETETEVAETTESEAESEVSEAAIESETEVSEEESETETPVETSETEASETELSESDTSSLTEAIDSESETSSVDAETTSLKKKKKKSKRSKKVKKHRKTAAHDEL